MAVGDVHGQADALQRLLKILEPVTCPVIFVGDYVDRGPDSIGVVEILSKITRPNFVFLLGNHDHGLMEALTLGRCEVCMAEERCAFQDYMALGPIPREHIRFFGRLKKLHRIGQVVFVHGGIPWHRRHQPPEEIPAVELINARSVSKDHSLTVVRGHSPTPEPIQLAADDILLDTSRAGLLSAGVVDCFAGKLLASIMIPCVTTSISQESL